MYDFYAKLARLFANENIGFVVEPSMQTAAFDLKSRTLYLPLWDIKNRNLHCFVIAHEVGHALWTPYESIWEDKKLKNILNIVEDYRIDNQIKRKFPGIIEDYKIGMQYLYDNHFFAPKEAIEVKIKDDSPSTFLDRLCLYLKLKSNIPFDSINFNATEKPLVREVIRAATFDDVKEVSQKIYEYLKDYIQEGENEEQQLIEDVIGASSMHESMEEKLKGEYKKSNENNIVINEPENVIVLTEREIYQKDSVRQILIESYGKYK